MAVKPKQRKLRSLTARHGRAIAFCGAPCDLEKGTVCETCREWRQRNRDRTVKREGESS
jgi:hypothetical protein